MSEVELKSFDQQIKLEMSDAADFAINDKIPDDSELWTDIYIKEKDE